VFFFSSEARAGERAGDATARGADECAGDAADCTDCWVDPAALGVRDDDDDDDDADDEAAASLRDSAVARAIMSTSSSSSLLIRFCAREM
jgi:hypothetical protein